MTILKDMIEEDFGISGRGKWFHSDQHDSLVYNAVDDQFFWNSRSIRGNALDYLVKVRGMEKSEARNFLNNYFGAFKENLETDGIPVRPYDRLVDVMWANGVNNRQYWYDRCLKDETIDRYKLGYYNGWNLIPLYEDGDFVNFQMRREKPNKAITQWYRGGKALPLYNEGILKFIDRVYITEGTVDAILLNQEGFPCVSPNGTSTWQQSWFNKFSHIKDIIYIADNDKPGYSGARLVAKSLGMYKVKIVTFNDKPEKYDSVDFFRDGGNKNTFREWIDEHSHFLFELEVVYGRTRDLGKYRKEFSWAR